MILNTSSTHSCLRFQCVKDGLGPCDPTNSVLIKKNRFRKIIEYNKYNTLLVFLCHNVNIVFIPSKDFFLKCNMKFMSFLDYFKSPLRKSVVRLFGSTLKSIVVYQ